MSKLFPDPTYIVPFLLVSAIQAGPSRCRNELQHSDRFLSKPPQQPKSFIARHLSGQGINSPVQFKSLEEAIKSGNSFIVRSETPHEYSGAAGLLESYVYTPELVSQAQMLALSVPWYEIKIGDVFALDRFLEKNSYPTSHIKRLSALIRYFRTQRENHFYNALRFYDTLPLSRYAELMTLDFKKINRSVSYSLWSFISGSNHFMVADSAVPHRYHLFSQRGDRSPYELSYVILQNGQILREAPAPDHWLSKTTLQFDESRYGRIEEFIQFYEKIRSASGFDPRHAPLVEFQCDRPGNYYFLQYHRSRNMQFAEFRVNPPSLRDNGYERVDFVRGSTPPSGYYLDIEINVDHPTILEGDGLRASYEMHDDFILREVLSRKKQVHFDLNNFNNFAMAIGCSGHCLISELFNPEISLSFDPYRGSLLPEETDLYNLSGFKAHLISDGFEAYIKILSHSLRSEREQNSNEI